MELYVQMWRYQISKSNSELSPGIYTPPLAAHYYGSIRHQVEPRTNIPHFVSWLKINLTPALGNGCVGACVFGSSEWKAFRVLVLSARQAGREGGRQADRPAGRPTGTKRNRTDEQETHDVQLSEVHGGSQEREGERGREGEKETGSVFFVIELPSCRPRGDE